MSDGADTAGEFISRRTVARSRRVTGASRRTVLIALTGSTTPDPVASIAIGGLLITVAITMGHDVSELLIGSATRPAERRAIAAAIEEFPEVQAVLQVLTMVLGPNSLLVAARIDFAHGLDDVRVERVSDEIEARLREVVPDVTEIFLDATTAPRPRAAGARRAAGG